MIIEQSPGEVFDRLTILEIKLVRIDDASLRRHVTAEHDRLVAAIAASEPIEGVEFLRSELKQINEALWDVEDALRDHERRHEFTESFIDLARSVYRLNDRRSDIKRRINEVAGSVFHDVKSYAAY